MQLMGKKVYQINEELATGMESMAIAWSVIEWLMYVDFLSALHFELQIGTQDTQVTGMTNIFPLNYSTVFQIIHLPEIGLLLLK